jgi:hypothetical protein
MRPELAALAADQGGLVTRQQAKRAGYTERELHTLTKVGGRWVVVRWGVYMERALWDALKHDGQLAAVDRAAHLVMRRTHIMSHDSAARAHGLPMLRDHVELVHVTRPGVGGARTDHGVKHHIGRVLPEVLTVGRLPVTNLARTALDLGREHGIGQGVGACDAAMRRGVSFADFQRELATMRCWPGVTRARAAAEYADPGAENIGESLARMLVIELGLVGDLETQFPVLVGRREYWVDIRVGCHLFEFDGRVKYLRRAQGGVSDRDAGDIVWDERTRQNEICALGLGMSRIIWADFYGAARERAKDRLRAEYAVTLARFGCILPAHLRETARRLRERGRRHAS